jgi:hypothetical protein
MSGTDTKIEQGSDEGQAETVESLKAQLSELQNSVSSLTAEATKNKALRRAAEKEKDALKAKVKNTESSDEDYKTLWEQSNEKLSKSLERAKKADINSALTAQFGKTKVASDRFDAATKLIDTNLIEWDEETGVDSRSVVAAVQKLKSEHKFLFEGTVDPTDVKNAGDAKQGSTITRSIFDTLSPKDKSAKMKSGVKVID